MNDLSAQLLGWSPELVDLINSVYISLLQGGYHPAEVFNRMCDYIDQHETPDLDACIRYGLKRNNEHESE